jgi:DNA-binding transcriptional regulator GbsR (MarR family)
MTAATAPTGALRTPTAPGAEPPSGQVPVPRSSMGSAPARVARPVAARPTAARPGRAPNAPGAGSASPSERLAADAVGALMELWGFRRQLGRVWTLLFLSERPLTAPALRERLGISSGLLSMSLAELRSWGAVRSLSVPGDRKARWVAETDVWRMVRRVLADRERHALERALAAFEAALAEARASLADADPRVRSAARFRAQRIALLAGLARTGLSLLQTLLRSARADLAPLRTLSGALATRRRAGGP